MTDLENILKAIEYYRYFSVPLNFLSAFCGIITASIVLILWNHRPPTCRSVSFRLSFWIGVVDCLYHFSLIPFDLPGILSHFRPQWFLYYIGWGPFFFPLVSILIFACIALDIYFIFVNTWSQRTKLFRFYIPFVTLFSLAVTLPFFFIFKVAYNETNNHTNYYTDGLNAIVVTFFIFTLWAFLAISFCAYVVIKVSLKLIKSAAELKQVSSFCHQNKNEYVDVTLYKVMRRLIWYPLIPIICQSPSMAAPYFELVSLEAFLVAYIVANFLISLQGIVNFWTFCYNPTLQKSWENYKDFLSSRFDLAHKQPSSNSQISHINPGLSCTLPSFNQLSYDSSDSSSLYTLTPDSNSSKNRSFPFKFSRLILSYLFRRPLKPMNQPPQTHLPKFS